MILPAATLSLYPLARITRLVRSSLVDVLNQDYVLAARARGVPELIVVGKHALKNASLPVVTVAALQLGHMLGGAVITETIFGWPGIGHYTVIAIQQRDFPVVQAAVLLSSGVFIALNLAVDLCTGTWIPGFATRDPATGEVPERRRPRARGAGDAERDLSVRGAALAPGPPPADEQELAVRLTPPWWSEGGSALHPLGTDQLGRDVLSRVVHGARVSVAVALAALAISGTIGVVIGLVAGYYGGRIDDWIMRVADVQLSIPYVLLAIAVIAVVGASTRNVVLVLALYGWVVYARLVRGQALSLRERQFVEAYRAIGATDWRIISRHILPNVLSGVIVVGSLSSPASSCSSHQCRFSGWASSRRP